MTTEPARGLVDESGKTIRLGERLGRGGEGDVHSLEGEETRVAKVLHPQRRAGKHAKVAAMVRAPPQGAHDLVDGFPVLTWPRDLLFGGTPAKDFVGYTMTRIRPEEFVPFHQVMSATRRAGLGGQALTFDRLVLLAYRLSHVVRTLHRFGYAVGDLNDRNVLVSRRLTPLLMDTDSFQVPDGKGGFHPSTVGDALYWPPDLLDTDLRTFMGSREGSDRYALATLLFQLFMAGMRPYQARGSQVDSLETVEAKARAGHFPWARPKRGVLEPPASAPRYAGLPRQLRALFEQCFVEGHRKPKRRPSADDWAITLGAIIAAGYTTCAIQPRHVFAKPERACPWCQDDNDPFTVKAQRRPAPTVARAVTTRPKEVLAKGGPGSKAPPQRPLVGPAASPSSKAPRKETKATTPRPAKAPRRKAGHGGKAKGQAPPQRRRGRLGVVVATFRRVPPKARWMAVLTGALLAAWLLAT